MNKSLSLLVESILLQDPSARIGLFVDAAESMTFSLNDEFENFVVEVERIKDRLTFVGSFSRTIDAIFAPVVSSGSDYRAIEEYLDRTNTPLDHIVVFSDGFSPEFTPGEPEKWTWLMTQDHWDWPARRGMSLYTHAAEPSYC